MVTTITHKSLNKKIKEILKYKTMYIYLIPAFVAVIIFSYLPMIGIAIAFQDYKPEMGFIGSPFVGLKHFKDFMVDPEFFRALKNTLGINSLMIVFGFVIPIIFALIINEIKFNVFKKVTQTITYLPHFISWVVISGMAYRLLEQESGNVNLLIEFLGGNKVAFLREPDYFWGILILLSIWKDVGWNSIIYLAAISGIDQQIYEAAHVDGAGRFKKMIYITIPGIAPVAVLLLIFSIGTLVNASGGASFDAIFNLQNPFLSDAANVLDLYIYKEGVQWLHTSYAAAMGLAQAVVAFGLVTVANSLSRRFAGFGIF